MLTRTTCGCPGASEADLTPATGNLARSTPVTFTASAGVGLDAALSIEATDDVGVTRVELELDGTLATTLTAGPWDTTLTVGEGEHSVVAVAYDDAGNLARSTPVTFTASAGVVTPPTKLEPVVGSCGCAGTSGAPFSLALALLGALARKRRR